MVANLLSVFMFVNGFGPFFLLFFLVKCVPRNEIGCLLWIELSDNLVDVEEVSLEDRHKLFGFHNPKVDQWAGLVLGWFHKIIYRKRFFKLCWIFWLE